MRDSGTPVPHPPFGARVPPILLNLPLQRAWYVCTVISTATKYKLVVLYANCSLFSLFCIKIVNIKHQQLQLS